MEPTNNISAELLEALDPTPEPPEPIRLSRTAWLDLIRRGQCEYGGYHYLWVSYGIIRINNRWLGHPDFMRHYEDVIRCVED